jgi:hypothetical protein
MRAIDQELTHQAAWLAGHPVCEPAAMDDSRPLKPVQDRPMDTVAVAFHVEWPAVPAEHPGGVLLVRTREQAVQCPVELGAVSTAVEIVGDPIIVGVGAKPALGY